MGSASLLCKSVAFSGLVGTPLSREEFGAVLHLMWLFSPDLKEKQTKSSCCIEDRNLVRWIWVQSVLCCEANQAVALGSELRKGPPWRLLTLVQSNDSMEPPLNSLIAHIQMLLKRVPMPLLVECYLWWHVRADEALLISQKSKLDLNARWTGEKKDWLFACENNITTCQQVEVAQ